MYILGFKKKSSPPQPPPPFKSRKINFDSIDDIGFNGDHIEVNPIEFFNNAEYPFIHLDGMNMVPGLTTPEDHGYYILYDKNTKDNNRRFYTSLGGAYPLDISYSTEINRWILTDTGKQDGGIIESTTLEGPWSKGKYGNEYIEDINLSVIPLSYINAMFKHETNDGLYIIFFNDNWTNHKMICLGCTNSNAAGSPDNISEPYSGLRTGSDYQWNTSDVNINELTKETPLNFTTGIMMASSVMTEWADTTITLLEE